MARRPRGETALRIGDQSYTLCLTLGALAEIEDRLSGGAGAIGMRDLLAIFAALLRGGGHDLSDSEVARLAVPPFELAQAVVEAFRAAGLGAASPRETGDG